MPSNGDVWGHCFPPLWGPKCPSGPQQSSLAVASAGKKLSKKLRLHVVLTQSLLVPRLVGVRSQPHHLYLMICVHGHGSAVLLHHRLGGEMHLQDLLHPLGMIQAA